MHPKRTRLNTPSLDSLLFIGNSLFYYNNSLHNHCNALTGKKLRCTSATINGSSLSWHPVDHYFDPRYIGSYSFTEGNKIVFNDPKRKPFDAAIMVDSTQGPLHPELKPIFFEFAAKHCATVRKHDADPILFMSWAYADKPEMTAHLGEAYTRAGNENNALVIPAGLAFARVRKEHENLNLYQPDLRHPSLEGTYLAACCVYASLLASSPEGNAYTAGLPPKTAQQLQFAAWQAIQDYYGPGKK